MIGESDGSWRASGWKGVEHFHAVLLSDVSSRQDPAWKGSCAKVVVCCRVLLAGRLVQAAHVSGVEGVLTDSKRKCLCLCRDESCPHICREYARA